MSQLRIERRRAAPARPRPTPSSPLALTSALTGTLASALVLPLLFLPVLTALVVSAVAMIAVVVVARHVLADLVAGMTLLVARPYRDGERIRLHTGDAVIEAEIVDIGLFRTTLCTGDGLVAVPNTRLLRVA